MSDSEIQHSSPQSHGIAGKFNGNSFVKDPVSGYLTMDCGQQFNGFTVEKKVLILKLLEDSPSNVGKVCKAVGITRQTFFNHYNVDLKFKHDVDSIRENHLDDIEETFMRQGKEKNGFMPGIATLRAYRKDRWNPDSTVTLRHESSITPAERAKRVSEVIDGELIEGQRKELEDR